MEVGPPKRRATMRPWAVITLHGTRGLVVTTTDGTVVRTRALQVHQGLAGLAGHAVYVRGLLTECRRIGGDARAWEASVWNGKAVSMTHTPTGVVVRSLRGTTDQDADWPEHLELFRGWLEDRGVGLGSVSSMARNLWRRTLATTYAIDTAPELARPALFGGRQAIRSARTYRHQVLLDLQAAYPAEMSNRPYALTWRKVAPSRTLDPSAAGLVAASVHIPTGLAYGLLPERYPGDDELVAYRRATTVRGVWSWGEVAAAVSCGAELVRVHANYAPATEADLFGPWWANVADGRALPGCAGRMVKATTSALWGIFAVRGEAMVMRWDTASGNGTPMVTAGPSRPNPYVRTAHLAVETTARVRTRLLVDVLANPDLPPPVHVDTDGVILRRGADVANVCGDGPGTWQLKRRMPTVEVKAAQVYRFLCGDRLCGHRDPLAAAVAGQRGDGWHYSVAGVPASMAAEVFRRTSRPATFTVDTPEWPAAELTTDEIWSPTP